MRVDMPAAKMMPATRLSHLLASISIYVHRQIAPVLTIPTGDRRERRWPKPIGS